MRQTIVAGLKAKQHKFIKVVRNRLVKVEWEEDKHPRADDGKFGSGGGSSGDSGGDDKPKEGKREKDTVGHKVKVQLTHKVVGIANQWLSKDKDAPWNAKKEDIVAGRVPGITYQEGYSYMGQLANDHINVGDTFFESDTESQKRLIIHEIGHIVGQAIIAESGDEWLDMLEPFRVDKQKTRSVRSSYDFPLSVRSRPEEIYADVYRGLLYGEDKMFEDPDSEYVKPQIALFNYVSKWAAQLKLPNKKIFQYPIGGES